MYHTIIPLTAVMLPLPAPLFMHVGDRDRAAYLRAKKIPAKFLFNDLGCSRPDSAYNLVVFCCGPRPPSLTGTGSSAPINYVNFSKTRVPAIAIPGQDHSWPCEHGLGLVDLFIHLPEGFLPVNGKGDSAAVGLLPKPCPRPGLGHPAG